MLNIVNKNGYFVENMQQLKKHLIMENLYGWLFTYNSVTKNWRCCKREQYLDLFSKPETEFLRSKDINTLIELVIKYNGDEKKIKL